MEDFARVQARLTNIRTVEPILEALRTISVGGWQMALKQMDWLDEYGRYLQAILPGLLPHLQPARPQPRQTAPVLKQVAVLVIGSERGLCGRFNAGLVEALGEYVQTHVLQGMDVHVWALGSRLVRLIRRRAWHLAWSGSLSVTSLPDFSTAWELSRAWLAEYEAHRLDAVDILYNAYYRSGVYTAVVLRVLPPALPPVARRELWPPPIIEGDAQRIYTRVVEQWVALKLYQTMIDSAASEHSTRFQLMESATQNADKLIFELTQVLQTERKQSITREMLELATGAGLIGPNHSR